LGGQELMKLLPWTLSFPQLFDILLSLKAPAKSSQGVHDSLMNNRGPRIIFDFPLFHHVLLLDASVV
jgi:hypothetical protein